MATYSVLYCKKGPKKRKTWLDGVLVVEGPKRCLSDSSGAHIGSTRSSSNGTLAPGSTFDLGQFEIDVQDINAVTGSSKSTSGAQKVTVVPRAAMTLKRPLGTSNGNSLLALAGNSEPVAVVSCKPVGVCSVPSPALAGASRLVRQPMSRQPLRLTGSSSQFRAPGRALSPPPQGSIGTAGHGSVPQAKRPRVPPHEMADPLTAAHVQSMIFKICAFFFLNLLDLPCTAA